MRPFFVLHKDILVSRHFFLIPLMGYLSDLVGRKPVYLVGAVLTAFWGFVGFPMMDTGNNWLIMAAITLGLAIESMTYAPYSALMAEMFPTHVRYTALSLCYQVAPIFAGSLAPLIAITLLNKYHSSTPIAWYLVGAALISIVAVGLTRETRGKSLHQVDAEAAARIAALCRLPPEPAETAKNTAPGRRVGKVGESEAARRRPLSQGGQASARVAGDEVVLVAAVAVALAVGVVLVAQDLGAVGQHRCGRGHRRAHDLLRGLEVVLGDRLLEVAARADELAGVHVDNRHRLGAVDDERTTRRQPHLAVERLLDLVFIETGPAQLVGEFILLDHYICIAVDVGLEKVHQYIKHDSPSSL